MPKLMTFPELVIHIIWNTSKQISVDPNKMYRPISMLTRTRHGGVRESTVKTTVAIDPELSFGDKTTYYIACRGEWKAESPFAFSPWKICPRDFSIFYIVIYLSHLGDDDFILCTFHIRKRMGDSGVPKTFRILFIARRHLYFPTWHILISALLLIDAAVTYLGT